MDMFRDILLQLLFALIPLVAYNVYYRDKYQNYSRRFIFYTTAACLPLSMLLATDLGGGFIFDIRYIIVFFGLLFGGWQTGALLVIEFVITRFLLGGEGRWIAMATMILTFPILLLLSRIFHYTHRRTLVTLLSGGVFSFIPWLMLLLVYPDLIMNNFEFSLLALPVTNAVGIWMLVMLFSQAVSDKELKIQYIHKEKVQAINHVAASLAHEVRNPLTAVKGFLQLIREKQPPMEKIELYTKICIEEIVRTESILTEYLSISKPLTQKRDYISLPQELKTVIEIMSPYATMHNVELVIERSVDPVIVYANPEELKQVLVNFVKNAIEACSERSDGRVTILMVLQGMKVILTIKDNGSGMTAEEIRRLGTVFFSSKSSGTGIGLTFSYEVIRTLGGQVQVQSKPGLGTTFSILLPLGKAKSLNTHDTKPEKL